MESNTVHPEFNQNTLQNNIALIRLKTDVIFNFYVQPICLPKTAEVIPFHVAVGFVETVKNGSGILKKMIIPKIDHTECREKVRKGLFVEKGIICAEKNPSKCNGDYGSPLGYPKFYSQQEVRFVQYGITSLKECSKHASIYTDVAFYMDWILAKILL